MKRLLLIITLAVTSIGVAQSAAKNEIGSTLQKFPNERINIHINNDFLISGEKLFYKVYCLNSENQFTNYSKIAYIELVNQDNKSVLKQKITLSNGKGYGDFFIDAKVKTGSYKLIAYTNWMLNKNNFFEKNVIIINPFSDKLMVEETNENAATTITSSSNESSGEYFKSVKNTYAKREKIKLDLSNEVFSKINTDFSISVGLKNNYEIAPAENTNTTANGSNTLFIPELRGSLIKGKINSKTGKLLNVKLALTYGNKTSLPLTAITNEFGEFYFNIENLNTKEVYITVIEKNKSDYTIELVEFGKLNHEFSKFAPIQLNKEIVTLIKNRSLYSQIENAYYTVKKDSVLKTTTKDLLLENIAIKYPLDDYTRFNTVKETFIEVIEGAGFYKKGDEYQINVTDTDASETLNYLPSLLIIDGRIIMNHTNFMNYNSRNIKTISLVKDKYYYGNAIYQGIVVVETFKGDYSEGSNDYTKFEVKPVQPEKIYFFQKHNQNDSRIPDFRTQIYWNPSVNIKTKELSFYSSDVSGTYEIVVRGYDTNGKLLSMKQEFTVK
ncbi:hypothetical protein ACOSP6_00955 [Tenacibaculum sp. MEBiC06402]|uniref:hypothetical protein n=1 Tax=unclassified Tenacibaculum TaxID=2635139 RepID=UPI003B9C7F69